MRVGTERFVYWAPRIAGVLTGLFLSLFALDAFAGKPFVEGLPDFVVHLFPAGIVLAIVALAWRFEWVGAAAFCALAVAYGVMVNWRLDWVAGISGPLAIVGILFLVSWRYHAAAAPAN